MESNSTTTASTVSPLFVFLLDQLKLHGLPLAMLAVAVWYFMGENNRIKADIQDCNSTLLQMYKSDRIQQLEVIENNTQALRELKLLHD